jgi:hypothetical protein
MKTRDLVIGLRDLSDTLNVCGNDYSDILYTAATQLEQRLLTDAEREAIRRAADTLRFLQADYGKTQTEKDAHTLLELLERLKCNDH